MGRSIQKVSVLVRSVFAVYNSSDAAVTGLINTDFTKLLTKDGAADATTVTVAEVASGIYTATFTPGSTGHWNLCIRNTTYNKRGWMEDFDVTTDGVLSLANITTNMLTGVIETGFTVKQTLQLIAAATASKCSGGPGSPVFRSLDDSADRISGTADSSGNRSAATFNV